MLSVALLIAFCFMLMPNMLLLLIIPAYTSSTCSQLRLAAIMSVVTPMQMVIIAASAKCVMSLVSSLC